MDMDDAREFNAKQRKSAAGKGQAMSDGSFPIKTEQDLKNAIQAYGRAKNKARAKAHIIKRARAMKKTNLLPDGWGSDSAGIDCPEEGCERHFLSPHLPADHAEAVHTFDDIRRLVSDHIRETFGREGDYRAAPPIPSIWVWVEDLATDWVVFTVEEGRDIKLLKASYSIMDGGVTLGESVEVQRRTVYEPVKKES